MSSVIEVSALVPPEREDARIDSIIGSRNVQFFETKILPKTSSNYSLDGPRVDPGAPEKPDMAGESPLPMTDVRLWKRRDIGT